MGESTETANRMLSKAMGHKVDIDLEAAKAEAAKAIVGISKHTGTLRETVTRITADQHEALVAQRVSKIQGELDQAKTLNKQLNDQIEELSVHDDGEEATHGELVAALDAAESATKDLECQNKRLRQSDTELNRENFRLHEEVADLNTEVRGLKLVEDSRFAR